VSGQDAWGALEDILDFFSNVIELLSQIVVIYSQARTAGGLSFVLVCFVSPIYSQLTYRRLWQKGMSSLV
jgi:hypothetical protein